TLWLGISAFYAVGFAFGARAQLTEAFVIPTGGMAETLRGAHKVVACPQCRHEFSVNCSCEMDAPLGMPPIPVIGCVCPNCRFEIDFRRDHLAPSCENGDRVLVTKGALSRALSPARFDALAFYYPQRWYSDGERVIYLKRLVGLPGETIAISRGKVY